MSCRVDLLQRPDRFAQRHAAHRQPLGEVPFGWEPRPRGYDPELDRSEQALECFLEGVARPDRAQEGVVGTVNHYQTRTNLSLRRLRSGLPCCHCVPPLPLSVLEGSLRALVRH